jgi:hypothetical protein
MRDTFLMGRQISGCFIRSLSLDKNNWQFVQAQDIILLIRELLKSRVASRRLREDVVGSHFNKLGLRNFP